MISNEAKLVDHCPKTPPSREPRSVDDEAERPPVASMCGSTAFASFTKSSFSIADFGCTCGMECSVSRLYSTMYRAPLRSLRSKGELTDGVMRTFRLRTSGQSGPHRRGAGCSAIIGSRPLHDADARRDTGTHACAHPYRRTTTTMKRSDHQRRNTLSENVIHVGTGFVAKERAHVVEVLSTLGPHFVTRELISRREFTVGWDDE